MTSVMDRSTFWLLLRTTIRSFAILVHDFKVGFEDVIFRYLVMQVLSHDLRQINFVYAFSGRNEKRNERMCKHSVLLAKTFRRTSRIYRLQPFKHRCKNSLKL